MSTKVYEGFILADKWNDGKIETFEKFCNEIKLIVAKIYNKEYCLANKKYQIIYDLSKLFDKQTNIKDPYQVCQEFTPIPDIAFFFFEGKIYGEIFNDNYDIRKTLIETNRNELRFFNSIFSGNQNTEYNPFLANRNSVLNAIQNPLVIGRIIVVGSTGKNENSNYYLAIDSCEGERVDVVAPGENIYSTAFSNRYICKSGTSMATPHVSGTAVLCLCLL